MKIALTADWHINEYNMLETLVSSYKYIIHECIKNKITELIIAGDVYDKWHASPIEKYNIYRVFQYAINNGIHIYIITGNHDVSERNGLHSMEEFTSLSSKNITVIDKPGVVNINGVEVGCIPHLAGHVLQEYTSFQKYVSTTLAKYPDVNFWVGHVLVSSVLPAVVEPSSRSVDGKVFAKVGPTPVFLGDIHKAQELPDAKNAVYIGSPDRITFSEAMDDKSFIVYDTDTTKYDRINIPAVKLIDVVINLSTKVGVVNGETFKVTDVLQEFKEFINVTGSIIKVRISGTKDELAMVDRDKLTKLILSKKPLDIKLLKFSSTDSTVVRDKSYTEEITPELAFDKWLDSKDLPSDLKIKVKEFGAEILNNEIT